MLRGRYHTDQNSQAWSKVLLVHNAIEHHCKEYFQSMMTRCQSTYRSCFSRLLSKRDMQDVILKTICHMYRRIFVYTFCLINICFSLRDDANNIYSEYWKDITVSVISENLSPIHRMVSEKYSSKKLEILQRMYGSLTSLPHSNFAVFYGWYFLQYCLQRAENRTNCST